jgi:cytochrome c oxidase subunit 1
MRRRIADYDPALGIEQTQMLITLAGLVIGWSVLIMSYNLVRSARSGERSGSNPWRSRSIEWQIPSPAPEGNYEEQPVIVGDPYDYGLADAPYTNLSPISGD